MFTFDFYLLPFKENSKFDWGFAFFMSSQFVGQTACVFARLSVCFCRGCLAFVWFLLDGFMISIISLFADMLFWCISIVYIYMHNVFGIFVIVIMIIIMWCYFPRGIGKHTEIVSLADMQWGLSWRKKNNFPMAYPFLAPSRLHSLPHFFSSRLLSSPLLSLRKRTREKNQSLFM